VATACAKGPFGPAPDGGPSACSGAAPVAATTLAQCTACTTSASCTFAEPLEACCTWLAEPKDPLAVGVGEHRYSTSDPNAVPDLSCLAQPGALGTPQLVTLTGYVWLLRSGQDSAGVRVEVLAENTPTAPDAATSSPDGSFSTMPIGAPYTTGLSDPIDPTDTTYSTFCGNGCSFRQFTIPGVPTETPLVLHTTDAGEGMWVDLFEYDVYFRNSDVQSGRVTYNATAVAASDLAVFGEMAEESPASDKGILIGEVHDCDNRRLAGATVETDQPHTGSLLYSTGDEGNPTLGLADDTSRLGLFFAMNLPPGTPIRVTSAGQCPSGAAAGAAPGCTAGGFAMVGTYVVQVFPGAVTALALRGRRPWQR
jgi:hypothetical protein